MRKRPLDGHRLRPILDLYIPKYNINPESKTGHGINRPTGGYDFKKIESRVGEKKRFKNRPKTS